jgi:Fe-S-cluster containining protein
LSELVELTLDNCEPEIAVDRVLPRQPENGHCVNLYGSPGEQIGCTIYEDRPQVCRAFDAGSDRCHEYRRIYGFEPRLTEMQIVTALCRIESVDRKERIVEARIVERERTTRFSFSAATGAVTEIGSIELKIVVFLEDEIPHEIHRFDPENEIWFETDFLTLGLAEAKELIASRSTRELI